MSDVACPRCGEPVVGAFATDPGFEEYEPCGCRVATDGGEDVDTVLACPECDSTTVESNVGHDMKGIPARSKHRCNDCGHGFEDHDAVHRERKQEVPPRGDSIARSLHDADPDDLATDGGVVEADLPELEFAEQYVEPIIYGEKTATVRIDGPDLGLRDRVKATDENGRLFAVLEIRGVATSGVFDALDILAVFDAEYDAETPHDVLAGLREHYDEPITPSTRVDIYVFEHARLPGDDGAGGDV